MVRFARMGIAVVGVSSGIALLRCVPAEFVFGPEDASADVVVEGGGDASIEASTDAAVAEDAAVDGNEDASFCTGKIGFCDDFERATIGKRWTSYPPAGDASLGIDASPWSSTNRALWATFPALTSSHAFLVHPLDLDGGAGHVIVEFTMSHVPHLALPVVSFWYGPADGGAPPPEVYLFIDNKGAVRLDNHVMANHTDSPPLEVDVDAPNRYRIELEMVDGGGSSVNVIANGTPPNVRLALPSVVHANAVVLGNYFANEDDGGGILWFDDVLITATP